MTTVVRGGVAKVAISLSRDLAIQIDRRRKALGMTRSAYIARAVREAIEAEGRARRVREYVSAYQSHPETASEVAVADAAASDAFASIEPQESWGSPRE